MHAPPSLQLLSDDETVAEPIALWPDDVTTERRVHWTAIV